jgi:hypothetical protein
MLNAGGDWPVKPGQPDFNMLQDIRAKIKKSPITWSFFWIESHQDHKGKYLDLNIICNNTAKAFWNYGAMAGPSIPANQQFGDEGLEREYQRTQTNPYLQRPTLGVYIRPPSFQVLEQQILLPSSAFHCD